MNALGHLLDFRRSYSDLTKIHSSVFIPSTIYIQGVKRYLSKKMKSDWREVLSVDYLNSINCWAKLEELQKVIPYHSEKYKQIILNASSPFTSIAAHDLSFATSFIVAALFLMVKASCAMTYQFLTLQMVESIGENGIINQTIFKTKEKYGFDSLIFSNDVLTLIKNYINFIRPRLNPCCDYVLICRNGKQISKLSNIFGRVVFLAIGKYTHILSHLITSYHILSPILHRKLFAVTTLNLVPRLRKLLPQLPTSYHVLSYLITSYPLYFTENYSQ